MQQRWTYRCYPTPEQEQILARTFGCVRYVYNWALALRSNAFKDGKRVGYAETDRALTLLKRQPETIWLNEVSSVALQQTLRDLQSAYSAFFAKRSAHPSFKKKDARASARFVRTGFRLDNQRLFVAKVGEMKVRWSRNLPAVPSSVTVIREASGRYFVSFVLDVETPALIATGDEVGIDFGISRLATLSTGDRVPNPRCGLKGAKRLAMLQRRLAKKQKGSRRRLLAKRAVARCHEKISDARKDALHKLTTRLVREFDVIHIEHLNLRGMVKNHALARSLSDAGIGIAMRMLDEKARRYGRKVIRVDRFFPSTKMCSCCGHIAPSIPLGIREWTCSKCGDVHDRDFNAAKNILAAGRVVAAHGFNVRAA
jgi:putative transposase